MQEPMTHGGMLVAHILKREGVEVVFTLSGGHIATIYDGCVRAGIRVMDTRHEQVAVHAAEGWARVTRQPGVALLTAGPGVTDGVTGIANAYQSASPVVIFGGAAPLDQIDRGALQELRHVDLVSSITKWARTIPSTRRVAEYTEMGFRKATTGRFGPVFLECPMDVMNNIIPSEEAIIPDEAPRGSRRTQAEPAEIARAAALLAQAERPVIFAGSAVWWDDAAQALRALAERLDAPVLLNGSARGSLAPDHPLLCAQARRTALGEADVIVLAGAKLDFRLGYGQPPLIPTTAKIIWLDTQAEDISANRGAEVGLPGDVGLNLAALTAELGKARRHSAWVARIRAVEEKAQAKEEALMASEAAPIHPLRLCRDLRDALERDAYVIGDGGDIVSFGARVLTPWEPGHWLDAGPLGTLGAGTGFAIAAKLARPDKQVVVLFGDGAFGLHGMEFETMARHNLPIVAVIGNDGQWAQIKHPQQAMLGHSTAADLRPGVRYDLMAEAFGCHGELVERPEDIRPAIERAFASGKPAVVNVLTDPTVVYGRSTQVAV
ncbi:MAG TPA: acetolactate synthase [Ktedonobacterales bacterium]